MNKCIFVLFFPLILTACNNDLQNQLTKKDKQIVSLEKIISEFENSEQSYFDGCINAYNASTGSLETSDGLLKATSAIDKCINASQKYPDGKNIKRVKTYLAESKKTLLYYTNLNEITKLADSGAYDGAISKLNAVKDEISAADAQVFAEYITKKANAPAVFVNYEEFHKAASTGMKVGKLYAVYTTLMRDGRRLCPHTALNSGGPDDYCLDVNSMIFVENYFTGDKARSFYDMRGKTACYVVNMESNREILINDFHAGPC